MANRLPRPCTLAPLGAALLATLWLGPGELAAQGDPAAEAILDATAVRYEAIASMCAEFSQVLEASVLRRTFRSRGTLCQEHPDHFAMTFSDPAGDRIVADGEWLWIYYPSTDARQVLRTPMASGVGRFDFAREFLDRASERYQATLLPDEVVDGTPVRVLDLEPRIPAAFSQARLWIDEVRGLIVRVRTQEDNGSVRTVDLTEVRLNPTIDPEIFRFVPPAGADVITRGP